MIGLLLVLAVAASTDVVAAAAVFAFGLIAGAFIVAMIRRDGNRSAR